ncbi:MULTISPECIES: cation diffusion facilitator family transporter [Pseudomonas]|uniref:Cation diffusion facilitator family transporter n=7 Tax=Pseudomonas TaxID=286 RepID=A0AAW5A6I0_9PSED|nr:MULTISPECIES: cation diffusion facilitator family transporter [Pseudomonas]NMX42250.1 cation transporter [Pseudomonas veronii]NQD56879.1 cation transporter [Pseudomonas sp. CM25]KAA0943616.1 cation transporter [Pseudomonas sp. ANT_H4]KAA0945492.1 cation transporter [Pseudomonas sp. ANT_H14]KAA8706235.1 cation transporter [Pseudomonas proteolytica]
MGSNHDHGSAAVREGHQKKLVMALALTGSFMIAEVIGAWITGSLALLSDASHMFTDTAALAISLIALQIAKRPADQKRTFGYARLEILASTLNAVLLFLVAMYILYEAYQRFFMPTEIATGAMMWIAIAGLIINLISMRLLASASNESLNVKGAYLEVWSDMLGSLGVIIAALIIRFTGWTWVDTIVAVAIGLWVLPRTWQLLRESLGILMEGVPRGLDVAAIETTIRNVDGVTDVHDLHVWAVSSGSNVMTSHVVVGDTADGDAVLAGVVEAVSDAFEIHHCTIQIERAAFHQSMPLPSH